MGDIFRKTNWTGCWRTPRPGPSRKEARPEKPGSSNPVDPKGCDFSRISAILMRILGPAPNLRRTEWNRYRFVSQAIFLFVLTLAASAAAPPQKIYWGDSVPQGLERGLAGQAPDRPRKDELTSGRPSSTEVLEFIDALRWSSENVTVLQHVHEPAPPELPGRGPRQSRASPRPKRRPNPGRPSSTSRATSIPTSPRPRKRS